jgi:hypothetical protein
MHKSDNDHYLDLVERQIPSRVKSHHIKPYDNFDWCYKLLRKGITATKISFNKPQNHKEVILKIDKDCT